MNSFKDIHTFSTLIPLVLKTADLKSGCQGWQMGI